MRIRMGMVRVKGWDTVESTAASFTVVAPSGLSGVLPVLPGFKRRGLVLGLQPCLVSSAVGSSSTA